MAGVLAYFGFDPDRMRSSSFKNSAVSSAGVFGGGLRKGITSDMAGPPLYKSALQVLSSPSIGAFLRHGFFRRPGIRLN
jgi:hypothetical protein